MFLELLCLRRTALALTAMVLITSGVAQASTAATATAGQTVTFTVTAMGTTPFTFQWTRNGANITGAVAATFVINNVQPADAATYCVVVSNSAGTTTSDNAILTIVPAVSAPIFTIQPASQTVTAGAAVTFAAAANGFPAPTYQWQVNGANISGATGTSYTITNTGLSNAGTYLLVASNSAGSVSSSGAVLTINTVPTITTQPTNQTVIAGQNASITIIGNGNPPPAYQWQQSVDGGKTWTNLANGTAFSGVSSATLLVISVPASVSSNPFRCLMTNSLGTVASSGVVLTVIAPPTSLQISIQIN